jgi:PadR family transcriptional regulator, regulatory protein PadR
LRSEVLKGHLDLLLLAALSAAPGHGYALVERLRDESGGAFDLSEGTVYPALYRLERAKLLASRWSVVGGRRRRIYSLTRTGRRELAERRRDWTLFAAAVKGVVGA